MVIDMPNRMVLPRYIIRRLSERAARIQKQEFLEKYKDKVMAQMDVSSLDEKKKKELFKPPQWEKDDQLTPYTSVLDDYNEMGRLSVQYLAHWPWMHVR